ncbi:MAG: acyl-CoA dehydrogenase family protein [Pseudomonadota bacterium]
MDFELSEERQMLKDTAERFIREQYPIEKRHAATKSEDGFDRAIWGEFCELGLVGALIDAEAGGYGGTGEDIALVFEELGRGGVVEPFLPTLLASIPLTAHKKRGEVQMDDVVEAAMEGRTHLAFAHTEPDAYYAETHVETSAEKIGDDWELTGRKAVVVNGGTADLLVVTGRTGGDVSDEAGLGLFLVSASSPHVEMVSHQSIDGPHVAEITLNKANGKPLGTPGSDWPLIEQTLAAGTLAVCAEAVGAMETCKDMTLDYLKERKQFGKPIGSNQVLQHRMVDMLLELEQARSVVMLAANTLEADRLTRELNISAAKNLIGRAGRLIAEESIQMHGGVAMTWEYAVPHFAKRVVMIDHLFGDSDHHLQRFAELSREAEAAADA